MTRITISAEAYRALSGKDAPRGAFAPEGDGYVLWLEPSVLRLLTASREPGEDYSDTILRLATEEVA